MNDRTKDTTWGNARCMYSSGLMAAIIQVELRSVGQGLIWLSLLGGGDMWKIKENNCSRSYNYWFKNKYYILYRPPPVDLNLEAWGVQQKLEIILTNVGSEPCSFNKSSTFVEHPPPPLFRKSCIRTVVWSATVLCSYSLAYINRPIYKKYAPTPLSQHCTLETPSPYTWTGPHQVAQLLWSFEECCSR